MRARALRAAPAGTIILIAVWTSLEVFRLTDARWIGVLLSILVFGLAAIAAATAFGWAWTRPIGVGLIGIVYFAAHAFALGISVVPDLLYLTVAIAYVELHVVADRFAPLYEVPLDASERRRMRRPLARAMLRLAMASVLAILVPLIAADLAIAGIVPATTIPSAILLAAALVAVVVLLALLPVLERRSA